MTIFERIIDVGEIEDAVTATLKKWLPTYVAEVERQKGMEAGTLPPVRSWATSSRMEALPGSDRTPMIVVVSPGLARAPVKEGNRIYRAPWLVGVAVVASARDDDTTRNVRNIYSAGVRAVMIQKQSLDQALDGEVRGIVWEDERYDDLDASTERTLKASRQFFTVEVHNVVTQGAGPVEPDPQEDPTEPWPEWPVVEEGQDGAVTTIPLGG